MKKHLLIIGALMMLTTLGACGNAEVKIEPVKQVVSAEKNKPTQEELNAKLKEEAIEHEYLALFRNEVPEEAKVKFTGEISGIIKGEPLGEFVLSQNLDNGLKATLKVINLNTATPIKIEVGKTVTVFGIYQGKDDIGTPTIAATVIE